MALCLRNYDSCTRKGMIITLVVDNVLTEGYLLTGLNHAASSSRYSAIKEVLASEATQRARKVIKSAWATSRVR